VATVLFADPDGGVASALTRTFGPAGVLLDPVQDGTSVVERARALRPVAIMAASDLPGLNGFTVCNRVKREPLLSGVPVVLMVADGVPAEAIQAHRDSLTPADEYVRKPVSPQDLLTKLRKLVDLPPAPSPIAAPPAPSGGGYGKVVARVKMPAGAPSAPSQPKVQPAPAPAPPPAPAPARARSSPANPRVAAAPAQDPATAQALAIAEAQIDRAVGKLQELSRQLGLEQEARAHAEAQIETARKERDAAREAADAARARMETLQRERDEALGANEAFKEEAARGRAKAAEAEAAMGKLAALEDALAQAREEAGRFRTDAEALRPQAARAGELEHQLAAAQETARDQAAALEAELRVAREHAVELEDELLDEIERLKAQQGAAPAPPAASSPDLAPRVRELEAQAESLIKERAALRVEMGRLRAEYEDAMRARPAAPAAPAPAAAAPPGDGAPPTPPPLPAED
jgi:CheY-like chemotaxis protein